MVIKNNTTHNRAPTLYNNTPPQIFGCTGRKFKGGKKNMKGGGYGFSPKMGNYKKRQYQLLHWLKWEFN